MLRRPPAALLAFAILALAGVSVGAPSTAPQPTGRLSVEPVESEPAHRSVPPIDELRREVREHPDDRTKRIALVRGLVLAKDLDGALTEATAWRAKDAYSLVAVRALGDVYMERGQREEAERVYSAIVELLPRDTDAQRSLATLLKARGDLPAAEDRLRAAVESRPGDARLLFELADVEQRLGKKAPAAERLGRVIEDKETSAQIRHPAKLRLAQILAEDRRAARARGDAAAEQAIGARLAGLQLDGGIENDLHVYLTWDTDRSDVDLWVITPSGRKVFYGDRHGPAGEALYDDVTTGYGPESFTAKHATRGDYLVQVNYFGGGRGAFPEARGEVVIVVDEGRPSERKQVLPYRLFAEKETVTVARVKVSS